MRVAKIVGIVLLAYAGIVVAFESMIGVLQPANQSTIVITTIDEGGTAHERVVSRLDSEDQLYVAANHWPRAWYRRALANPDVRASVDDQTRDYRAVPVDGAEHDRVEREHPHSLAFRILTGFPPRRFLRLEPRPDGRASGS
ncbi:MAG: nitroreductase/quinone reductase family protein [Myxococcota bacterium]